MRWLRTLLCLLLVACIAEARPPSYSPQVAALGGGTPAVEWTAVDLSTGNWTTNADSYLTTGVSQGADVYRLTVDHTVANRTFPGSWPRVPFDCITGWDPLTESAQVRITVSTAYTDVAGTPGFVAIVGAGLKSATTGAGAVQGFVYDPTSGQRFVYEGALNTALSVQTSDETISTHVFDFSGTLYDIEVDKIQVGYDTASGAWCGIATQDRNTGGTNAADTADVKVEYRIIASDAG